MTWRNWSFLIVLILMNYLVFSVLGSYVFTSSTETTPTHTPQPTFTPGARALTPVAPLPYSFLTPSPISGAARGIITATVASASSPAAVTVTPTRSP
jgi:hypothetical protein